MFDHIVGPDGFFGPALLRTAVYVLLASVLCLLIAYPVAYYTARLSGRHRKGCCSRCSSRRSGSAT